MLCYLFFTALYIQCMKHHVILPFKWNHEDRWHWAFHKRFFQCCKDIQEGGDWWNTYLVSASITLVMFPLSIKFIWFPSKGLAGRAEIWQPHQGQKGSSCKYHFHWCAWKWTKSGNAYAIREETLPDLIFERGLRRSPERVLLIHCPGPLCGHTDYTMVNDKKTCWKKRGSAFALITRINFPISHWGIISTAEVKGTKFCYISAV